MSNFVTIDNAVIGGNRDANDSDEHLLQTLRTCRLEVLVERGLDGAIGQASMRYNQQFVKVG